MFQNAWYSRRTGAGGFSFEGLPPDFITCNQIEYVRCLYYDEHCLECSAPACYGTCGKYRKRADGACRRMVYGIAPGSRHSALLNHVRLQFRSWAKLEARINRGVLSVRQLQKMERFDYIKTISFKLLSKLFLQKDYKFSRLFDGLKRRKYAQIDSAAPFVNDFLLQGYFAGTEDFNLILEITDNKNNCVFKTSFPVSHGYFQHFVKLDFDQEENGLVRLYPENNFRAELELFAADFVRLKSEIPLRPAPKLKCVAWDLDRTLWDGILMETSSGKMQLRPGVGELIRKLDERGILQIIVSKNDPEQVTPVLTALGLKDYFIYILANWNAKSHNLFMAARLLNIGLNSLALIDDSAFERAEVSETLPCVRCYNEGIIDKLLLLPETDLPISAESSQRRMSYLIENKRNELRMNFSGNNVDFIRGCNLEIEIGPIHNDIERKRSYELISRTNQLNLSARKYTQSDFETLLSNSKFRSYIVMAHDRFGNYGQVAFLLLSVTEAELIVSEFAMSCRVAGKYVESAIFDYLQKQHVLPIRLCGKRTERNSTLTDALNRAGFIDESSAENLLFSLPMTQKLKNIDIVKVTEM